MAIKIPIIAELNKTGFRQTFAEFRKLETNAQRFQFVMGKATSPAGLTAMAGAATTAAYAIFNMAQAAADDQRSQVILANALKNTVGATDAQIASTEELITQMQMAAGISDTELRTGFQNLARATKDVTKSQDLLTLATDISVGTGRSLESVTLALGRAYQGNYGALTRLGVQIDAGAVKSKDFQAVTQQLSDTFGGAAAQAADTYAGKMRIATERINEAKETIGRVFIPLLADLAEAIEPATNGLTKLADAAGYLNEKAKNNTGIRALVAFLNPFRLANISPSTPSIADIIGDGTREFENNQYASKSWLNQIGKVPEVLAETSDSLRNFGSTASDSFVEAETAAERFLKAMAATRDQLANTFRGMFNLSSSYDPAKGIRSFLQGASGMAAKIKQYGKDLIQLQAKGLGPAAIQGIMQMDLLSGADVARDLLDSALLNKNIRTLNRAYTTVGNTSQMVGQQLAFGQMTGQSITQYITIPNADPTAVVNALRRYQNANGAIPIRVSGTA